MEKVTPIHPPRKTPLEERLDSIEQDARARLVRDSDQRASETLELVAEVRRLLPAERRLHYHHVRDAVRGPEDPASWVNPKYKTADVDPACQRCVESDELAKIDFGPSRL
jgi:hypothetical protein